MTFENFASTAIALERRNHAGWLWLTNAKRKNALGNAFWHDFPLAIEALDGDPDVRCIVIAAKGDAFCSGLDLREAGLSALSADSEGDRSRGPDAAWRTTLYHHVKRLQAALTSAPAAAKPVIGAAHGLCLGGGVDLLAACDIRLAADDVVFSVRETRIAMVADVGTIQRLPRAISPTIANELIFTGRDFGAAYAHQHGFISNRYADAAALHDAAQALADEIGANSPLAVQGAKRVMQAGRDLTVAQGLDYVALWNSAFIHSSDLVEAMTAFVERRPPHFTGA